MIVLLVHQSAEMYGSDKVLLFLAQGLLKNNAFVPVVVLPETGPLYTALTAAGVEVHVSPVAKISRSAMTPVGLIKLTWQTLKAVRGLDQVVRGRPVAVVHSNTLAVLSGAAWALLRRKQHLWHVHEIILKPKLVSRIFPYLVRLLSDKVMSNSTLTEKWLLSEQPTLASQSVVAFNGLPAIEQRSASAVLRFRSSVGAGADDIVITLAGRLNKWKGQELLLAAATELKRRGRAEALRVVIVGGPAPGLESLPVELKARAVTGGIDGFCTFVEFVEDIWPVWFGSDIAVVPSTEPEPFGMVAIEAMAAGVPVIAAAHGGLLDIVVHGETGLLFTPCNALSLADAIETLARDATLRKSLGGAGKLRQKSFFSVDSQVALTEKTYTEMVVCKA